MKKKIFTLLFATTLTGVALAGCAAETSKTTESSTAKTTETTTKEEKKETSKGSEYTSILSATNWQGTVVKDANGNDLTEQNAEFIGLAKYDEKTGYYEFFDK